VTESFVCSKCGVACVLSRSGRWLHVDELPAHTEPHDADPVSAEEFGSNRATVLQEQVVAARAYARDLRVRMARPEMEGVRWADAATHAVVLLGALERLEEAKPSS
jgi:hypothetical protein